MRRYFLVIFILFFVATSAYANKDKEIKDTILKYDFGIIKMAKSGKTDFFKSFLKKDVATKLMLWVKSWQDNNLVMIARINDLKFLPIYYNEHNATITTLENWSFTYVYIKTKKMMPKPVNIFYKMRYTLKKENEKWMIVKIEHLKEEIFDKSKKVKKSDESTEKKRFEKTLLPYGDKKTTTHK